jgi:predicted porin
MKHAIQRAVPLILATLAGAAAAQSSSLIVFGTADASARYASTDRSGSIKSLASGGYSSARYGLRGQEDLGGGWSASFWLESFLSLDTGLATPAGWQRRSTVSLASKDYGELRLGRDYTPTHSNWARFDPFGYVGIGSNQLLILSATGQTPVTAAFGSNPNDVQRANNGIAYFLPRNEWNVEGALVRNLREGGTAATDSHSSTGARLGVTVGPVLVSGAMLNTRNDITGNNTFKDSALATMVTLPAVSLRAAIRTLKYTTAKQDTTLLAALIPLAGVHEIKLSWVRSKMNGKVGATDISANSTDQYALGHVYHFSKRTHLYTTLASMRNKGNARFVVPGGPAATAGGLASKGTEMGLNHEF